MPPSQEERSCILQVELTIVRMLDDPGIAYGLDVTAKQITTLSRDRSITCLSTTWQRGQVGILGRKVIDDLRGIVGDRVDEFINDYLAANPKK